jgi:hypothetical protein
VRGGLGALRASVEAGREAFDFLLSAKAARHDLATVPGKAVALDETLEALCRVDSDVRRALYVKRASEEYRVPEEVVSARLREMRSRVAPSRGGQSPRHPLDAAGTSAAQSPAPAAAPQRPPEGPPPVVEEMLLESLLGSAELLPEVAERLPLDAVTHRGCREILRRLLDSARSAEGRTEPDAVIATLEEPSLAALAASLRSRGDGKDLLRQGRDCLGRLLARLEQVRLADSLVENLDPTERTRPLRTDENERLRAWTELHRRRAGRVS